VRCELSCGQVGAEPDAAVCALVAELVQQRSMDGRLLPENVAVWRADDLGVEWLIGVGRCSSAAISCPTFGVLSCQGTDILRRMLD